MSERALSEIDDDFEVRKRPLNEVFPNLFHGHPLRLDQANDGRILGNVVESNPGTPAQLLGAKGGDVDEQETAFDGRGLGVNERAVIDGGIYLRDFDFRHSPSVYRKAPKLSNRNEKTAAPQLVVYTTPA
jgi:hypothetical protein